MQGTLRLKDNIYNIQAENDTRLYIMESDENEGTLTVSVDILFESGEYDGEDVTPYICINEHETNVSDVSELAGKSFSVDNVDEADEREDTFYLFEHEPMERYKMTILEIENDQMHIEIAGVAITDGYANPYKTDDFSIDCWLDIPKED